MRNSIQRISLMMASALLGLTLTTVIASAQVMSGGNYQVTSSVQASGGGASNNGSKTIEGTVGQPSAGGPATNATLVHNSGFWFATTSLSAVPTPTPTPSPTPTPAATPAISISDVTQSEGNSGTSSFTFTVSLSAVSNQTVSVSYATSDGTATNGVDYHAVAGSLVFAPGETSKQIVVLVNGDAQVEPNETFLLTLFDSMAATITKAQGAATIVNDDSGPTTTVQFSAANYSVQEDLTSLLITVNRTGDIAGAASVDYFTVDGSAPQKSDFEYAAGTLSFAAGETSKTFQLLINEDMYAEGPESFQVQLANPVGASLGQQASATIVIGDDALESTTNPVDEAQSFVHLHYHDFLNREPDAAGLAFWTSQITECGNDAQCVEAKRVNVSAAFFLSIEFQQTGYLLYLLEKESFTSMPKYTAFMRDLQEVSQGVIVNAPGWEQKLKDNQQQFADKWVNRPAFKAIYDGMSNTQYVNALCANAGIPVSQAEKQTLVNALDTASESRAAVLLDVAGNASFREQEHNAAFVMVQYFGYLRRDPNALPDSDLSGYNFWLKKLNEFGGNYINAEMVKAFIVSSEYRKRFGQ